MRKELTQPGICFYCGEPSLHWDHVIPTSYLKKHFWSQGSDMPELLVPSCQECNMIAGGKFDRTLYNRRERVKLGIKKKYRKIICIPKWTDDEISELGEVLRLDITRSLRLQQQIIVRVMWKNNLKLSRETLKRSLVDLAISYLSLGDGGRTSVQNHAEQDTTQPKELVMRRRLETYKRL